jgi:hypothetical protein
MAIVTFPIELGGSGLVVSDDTDPTTGLRNGGYLTRFVPALQQTVAVAGFVVGQASAAASSASDASGFATAASGSALSAAGSAASAASLYDQFDDRILGPKSSNPTVDNDGNALLVGAMYFNTAAMETRVWNGTSWQSASVNGGTVSTLTVTGAFEYQGTLTGGTGVINIGGGQLYKSEAGLFGYGKTDPEVKVDIAAGNVGLRHKSSTNIGTIRVDSTGSGGGGQFEAYQNSTLLGGFGAASAFIGGSSDNVGIGAARAGAGVDIYTNGTSALVARWFSTGQYSIGRPDTQGKLTVETASSAERVGFFRNSAGTGAIQVNSNTNTNGWWVYCLY